MNYNKKSVEDIDVKGKRVLIYNRQGRASI